MVKQLILLLIIYLGVALKFHQKRNVPFFPTKQCGCLTNYGLFAGLGVFLAGLFVTKYNINFTILALLAVLPMVIRFLFCQNCNTEYNVTVFYVFLIPLILLALGGGGSGVETEKIQMLLMKSLRIK